jgi:hypothetical protein
MVARTLAASQGTGISAEAQQSGPAELALVRADGIEPATFAL